MSGTAEPRTYVASYGRYLEDFQPGDVYEHRPGRTITEADNIQFSLLTMNRHPLHCDREFAAASEFRQPLVNSALTLASVCTATRLYCASARVQTRFSA